MAVLDASFYVALMHAGDEHHPAAHRWFAPAVEAGEGFQAPSILAAEVGGALRRVTDDEQVARKVVDQLIEARLVAIWPLDEELGARAAHLAIAARLKGADAVYLAVAERLNEALITFDREVFERGAAYVDTVYPP